MTQKEEEASVRHDGSTTARENILKAAVELFAKYGYHAAPLREIARLAGIQAASIYYH